MQAAVIKAGRDEELPAAWVQWIESHRGITIETVVHVPGGHLLVAYSLPGQPVTEEKPKRGPGRPRKDSYDPWRTSK